MSRIATVHFQLNQMLIGCASGLGRLVDMELWKCSHLHNVAACRSEARLHLVKAWIALESKLQLEDLVHDHLKCGSILDRDPTIRWSVRAFFV